MKKRPEDDSASEPDAFAREMADVVPLPKDPRGRVRPVPTVHAAPSGPAQRRDITGAHDLHDVEAYAAPGVSRREIKKLKRGDYEPEAEEDLHALSVVDAAARVMRFIDSSRHRGYRCVVIIHGRGANSPDGVPVVKPRVRELLRNHAGVLAFADGPPGGGGPGAVYVLLRRTQRDRR